MNLTEVNQNALAIALVKAINALTKLIEGVDVCERRSSYPFDAKDVPGDYVLAGDNRWYPHPKRKD